MRSYGIKLMDAKVFTKGGKIICKMVQPNWKFIDGKPSNERIGTKYTVILTGNGFMQVTIKTPEMHPTITMDDIDAMGGALEIEIEDFYATPYAKIENGKAIPMFSLNASSVRASETQGF